MVDRDAALVLHERIRVVGADTVWQEVLHDVDKACATEMADNQQWCAENLSAHPDIVQFVHAVCSNAEFKYDNGGWLARRNKTLHKVPNVPKELLMHVQCLVLLKGVSPLSLVNAIAESKRWLRRLAVERVAQ